ncbi:hypothetical protein [Oleiagrimonas sp. MCCC 1A03011]|uniref:hypothetical protein n=1 Tax=Oleiagrimonas sp. MCCC 1A03011 TaxID=1926883 RepID=UPI000DC24501|nr:hypothetical protein [Oleiagrimonas sp. MCCC 1A03011]RAP57105.1 hypothetical protein BTJ49_11070 [Oleiagrimonas sp. MCCC 1A03011]
MSFLLFQAVSESDPVSERFDRFEVTIERALTSVKAHEYANAIFSSLAQLPVRDRFALTVEVSGDGKLIGELAKRDEIIEHIESYHEDGEVISFRIEILKEVVDQCLSVYSPTALGAYLESAPFEDALTALSSRFQDRLIFECYSETPGRGSPTLSFVRAGEANPDTLSPFAWRQRALALLHDNAFRTSNFGTLVPQDFAISQPIGVVTIDAFISRASAVVSAMFLSNFSDLSGDQLSYRISGYKLLSGTVDNFSSLADDAATFQRVADWAYGAEGNSDKIGLARNVITLCVDRLEDVPSHPEIWDAIQSNYQIYLKENIATYLEVRNKLAELLAESTHKTQALVEGLLDSIRNGVLVILTFLLTVVVINGLKDTGLKVIFSVEYLAVALTLLVLSSLAIWASCRDARSRFEQSAKATADLLRRMYAHVMIARELEVQVAPTVDENRSYIGRQANKYLGFWLCFALLVAIAFGVGHVVFGATTAPPASARAHVNNEKRTGVRQGGVVPHASVDARQQALASGAASVEHRSSAAGHFASGSGRPKVLHPGAGPSQRHPLGNRADRAPVPSSATKRLRGAEGIGLKSVQRGGGGGE